MCKVIFLKIPLHLYIKKHQEMYDLALPCTSGSRDYGVFVYRFPAAVNAVIVMNSWEWDMSSLRQEMLSKRPLASWKSSEYALLPHIP